MAGSWIEHWPEASKALGIFLLTFASEDAATFGSGFLAGARQVSWPVAFLSCFLGIWIGDLGLYALARKCGRPWAENLLKRARVPPGYLEKSEKWFQEKGTGALILCRFVPWSRLPTFLVAGLLRVSAIRFSIVTGLMALLWVGLIYGLVGLMGRAALNAWIRWRGGFLSGFLILVGVGLATAAVFWIIKSLPQWVRSPGCQRWLRWEFWPAWLFYPPVVLNYLWLGLKYRHWTLPTAANPGMTTGGLVGESKFAILRDLHAAHPEAVAEAFLINDPTPTERLQAWDRIRADPRWALPIIAKPDLGQRGVGFRILHTDEKVRDYLSRVPGDVILQRYIRGPREVGIFYYRLPDQDCGKIFAVTEKIFPEVISDGQSTVAQLIEGDPRAVLLADTYRRRLATQLDRVPAPGETVRLVEAGNHAQGCIFRDGIELVTPALTARIDEISRSLHGFYIGRYDIRYETPQDLAEGRNFFIIELNGAASEATSIYDARTSLFEAYRTLFAQWDLVFAIGSANRRRGYPPDSPTFLWSEWQKYRKLSRGYPLAD